jgi:hypothetical protein
VCEFTGDGKVIHRASPDGCSLRAKKSEKAIIREDELKDIVDEDGQLEIANYMDGTAS